MAVPILVKPIPAQVINERAAYGPFQLKDYIQTTTPDPNLHFTAVLKNDDALPKGMICTSDGVLTGIPAAGTEGIYEISVTAENEEGFVQATFILTIKPSLATSETEYADRLKSQVWEALEKHLPVPELNEMLSRPITSIDIYHLLERWGILKIWDAFNLDAPGPLIPLTLEGVSPYYQVYDRGSCLIACPKDLFSDERTIEDGLQTARALAREVYKREWVIEIAGFDKLVRAAWVELQHLGDKHGKYLEITNFKPTFLDVKLYNTQALEKKISLDR